MPRSTAPARLELVSIDTHPLEGNAEEVHLHTDAGTIRCRHHHAAEGDAAVLWVFGAGGGWGGPAGGLYPRLAQQLSREGVASLEVAYREPGDLIPCLLDTLMGTAYLETLGRRRVVAVGHSFGGAVVINAGVMSPSVVAVAALSSQTLGTDSVSRLAPKPLLLLHGTDDEVLPDRCSRLIHADAKEPKRLLLYAGCRHGLDDCRDEIDRDLLTWLRNVALR